MYKSKEISISGSIINNKKFYKAFTFHPTIHQPPWFFTYVLRIGIEREITFYSYYYESGEVRFMNRRGCI